MAGPGFLVSYPAKFFPGTIAEGFIQRIQFRFEHDKLRLSNKSLKKLFSNMCADEKQRALMMLKDMPTYAFAYNLLRSKAKIKKEVVRNKFTEVLVDKVAGIPYGNRTFLDIALIRDKNNDILLRMRVFRGIEGEAWATRFGFAVPAHIMPDIRNALDRLGSRHKSKLSLAREEAAKKYSPNPNSNRLGNVRSKKDQDERTEQDNT